MPSAGDDKNYDRLLLLALVPALLAGEAMTPSDLPDKLLDVIRHADLRGDVPSVRELQAECHISSTSVVLYNLRALERRGLIALGRKGASRSYRLTPIGRGAATADELLLQRCLKVLELYVVNGSPLLDDLKARLC